MPEVTIIIPVYNGEKYLREAIDSILCQTHSDFVLLIINDCSKDKSVEIIKSYNDQRIKLLDNEKNLGLSASLNIAIKNANSKYIARMDQDDISLPNRIEEQLKFMKENQDIGICGTYIEKFGVDEPRTVKNPTKHDDIKVELLFQNPIAHPAVMINKEILDKHNFRYDTAYDGAEDYDLWERMSNSTKLANMPKVLLRYRIHESQLSRIAPEKQAKIDKIINRQWEKMGVSNHNLKAILSANKNKHIYNNWSLRKKIFNTNYLAFKKKIKKAIKIC